MPLVEIIRGPETSPSAVAAARSLAKRMGKTPIVVADAPGFVVNRLLMPYLAAALRFVSAGGRVEDLDRALVKFGMPMGPIALLDQIGLDVAAKVSRVLSAAFGDHLPPDRSLEALAQSGWLGSKSGAGFYTYAGGKRKAINEKAVALVRQVGRHAGDVARGASEAAPLRASDRAGTGGADPATARLVLYPMINEAARLLDERVVDDPRTIDVAMVFGTGFPPFLGGPLRWADAEGIAKVAAALRSIAARHGAWLAPCARLAGMAESGGRFHPA
jgi:3-hydroxyacyl-CoA dehydrogenase/enoyl-CoA hydratase/3-hydroxybutyryl-CoA epimerase